MRNFELGQIFQHRFAVVAALALIAASVGLFSFLRSNSALAAADSDSQSSALASLLGRSPGERSDNLDLLKKGVAKLAEKIGVATGEPDAAPEQRALGKIFDETPEEAVQVFTGQPPLLTTDDVDPGVTAPGAGLAGIGSPGPGIGGPIGGVAPGGGGFGGSSGGGSGGGTSEPGDGGTTEPVNPTTPDVDVVGAVPEPSTWMLLIIGMFASAFAMRRRNPTALGNRRTCVSNL